MSQSIGEVKGLKLANMGNGLRDHISVNAFWGGSERGTCVQLTLDGEWVQLDGPSAMLLIKMIECAMHGGHKHVCVYCGNEHSENEST